MKKQEFMPKWGWYLTTSIAIFFVLLIGGMKFYLYNAKLNMTYKKALEERYQQELILLEKKGKESENKTVMDELLEKKGKESKNKILMDEWREPRCECLDWKDEYAKNPVRFKKAQYRVDDKFLKIVDISGWELLGNHNTATVTFKCSKCGTCYDKDYITSDVVKMNVGDCEYVSGIITDKTFNTFRLK